MAGTVADIFGADFSPLQESPRLGLIPIPQMLVTSTVASTGSGVISLTAAQLLGGFIIVDCQDAQSANLPAAEDLIAAIPGPTGSASHSQGACGFRFTVKNSGDSTLTLVAGTGCTLTGTATVVTTELRDYLVVITNAKVGSAAYTCYVGNHSTF